MSKKHRDVQLAAQAMKRKPPDTDDDAPEVLDWFEKWAATPAQSDTNDNQRSKE